MSNQETKAPVITKFVPVIMIIVGLIVSYVTLQNQQVSADARLDKIEIKQASQDTANTQILVELGSIRADLGWIKLNLK